MKEIIFDNNTSIFLGKFNINKESVLEFCKNTISEKKLKYIKIPVYENISLGLNEKLPIQKELDHLINIAIEKCKFLYEDRSYNNIVTQCWINILKGDPTENLKNIQTQEKYHIHSEINETSGYFYPHYAYVFYLQMPNELEGDDAVLWVKGNNNKEYKILPKENEFIIMEGHIPHAPEFAKNSQRERIVFAGNIGFRTLKKNLSVI